MTGRYWDEPHETMSSSQMRAFQTERLREQLGYVYDRMPFYRNAFDQAGISPDDFHTPADLARFPFTLKTDLAANYPYGMSAVETPRIIRIHASSGTTGKPSPGMYTREDLDQWTECMARGLWAQGVRPETILQNANGMGLFTGGLGFHQGALRIGATVLPTGTGMTERQITLMKDFGVTALTCTASYCLTIIERCEQIGVDPKSLKLKTGHFGAEPWSEEMRKEIEQRTGMRAYEHYGLTEMMGPGVAFNCDHYRLHINEDHVYPEIVDPVTLAPLPPGEKGELVFTALQRKAMPLIRYRTRDICTLRKETCECGRTLVVMDKVLGRTDDMMIISGVNVFPSQVESVLMTFDAVEPVYRIRITRKDRRDQITVETEAKAEIYQDPAKIAGLEKAVSAKIKQTVGINVPVVVVEKDSLPRSQGKAQRIVDERAKQ